MLFLHKTFPFISLKLTIFESNGRLFLYFETRRIEVCDIFSLYHSILYAFHHEPYYAHCKMNNLIYFLSSQSRVFSALWSFSSPSSKAPFKSVIILLFRWGEDYSGIRQHHFNNVIIFVLLFSVPFTKQANISASLAISFYPWIATGQHQDTLMLWSPSELMLLVKNPVKNTLIPVSSLINIYLSALVSICHSTAFSPGLLVGFGLWLIYLCVTSTSCYLANSSLSSYPY